MLPPASPRNLCDVLGIIHEDATASSPNRMSVLLTCFNHGWRERQSAAAMSWHLRHATTLRRAHAGLVMGQGDARRSHESKSHKSIDNTQLSDFGGYSSKLQRPSQQCRSSIPQSSHPFRIAPFGWTQNLPKISLVTAHLAANLRVRSST